MPAEEEGILGERPQGLDERVLSTLQGLSGRIAFSGLRRALGAHPESLSRSLRRLEREGRVTRSHEGYRAVEDRPRAMARDPRELRSIAQVELPPGMGSDAVLGRLAGRWFGSLRWVGIVEGPTERMLAWARRDGTANVLLGIHRGVLRVYAREKDAMDDDGDIEDSAYELLTHAVEALRFSKGGAAGAVSFLAADPDATLAWVNS